MVGAHNGSHGVGKRHLLQNLRPHDGVNLHLLEFFGSEAAGLVDDVVGNRQFSNIVQKSGGPQGIQVLGAQFHILGDLDGIGAHTMQVGMGGVVLGVDGQRQSLDGAQMQGADLFDVALLGFHVRRLHFGAFFRVLQAAQVKMIGTIDPEHDGHDEERVLPAHVAIAEAHQAHDGRAHQVIRK